ncbi:hypothetical protein LTR22_021883 [Elasticomyces elasticus]|nr:hypothetical protein LTR22_021883 [Elasticomyces elasticus]
MPGAAPINNNNNMSDTTTLTSHNPQQNSRLLSLTPELRNRIYHYVFCISDGDDMVFLTRSVPANKAISHQAPSESSMLDRIETSKPSVLTMLQTCRQILNEAEALFFHLNHFTLPTILSDPGGELKIEAECNHAFTDFPDLSFVQEFAITTTYTDDAYVALVAKWNTRFKALICSTQEH